MNRKRLRLARKNAGFTQAKLAEALFVSQSLITAWESGARDPGSEMIARLADVLHVTTGWLLGAEEGTGDPQSVRIPVYDTIRAGIPAEAVDDVIDWEEIPKAWTTGGKEYFAVRLRGDSMYPEYLDRDVVIFRRSECCETGDDCAVRINGDDATFKRVRLLDSGMVLQPLNPSYSPLMYTADQVRDLPVEIIGVEVELRRRKRR